MPVVSFHYKGDNSKTSKWLEKLKRADFLSKLDEYGQLGVMALSAATPQDTGETAASWDYKIERKDDGAIITWTNSNVVHGVNIAVILQYGHGTRNGGYVQGIDYINPAMKPIFDGIAESAWKEVRSV